jgi:Family of unknown function (DUF6069)
MLCMTNRAAARGATVVAATVVAAAMWIGGPAPEHSLRVRSGDSWTTVGLPAVLVTAALAATAAMVLLAVLDRTVRRPCRVWTALAVVVLLLSLAGPAQGRDSVDIAALAALHVGVGVTVIVSGRRTARPDRPSAVVPAVDLAPAAPAHAAAPSR